MKSVSISWMRRGIVRLLAVGSVLSLVSCQSLRSSTLDSGEGPRPIAALLHTNVLDVAGPTPCVVVYESGQVILTAWEKAGADVVRKHRAFMLSAVELDALREQVHQLAVLKPQRSYKALDDGWMVMDSSDTKMYVRDGRREASVSVYALEFVLRDRAKKINLRPPEKGGPPPQFMSLYHRLKTLADTPFPLARRWTPCQVEVRLRDDFKHLDSRPVPWPKDWPTPNSPSARGEHAWEVLLDGSELPNLRRLLPFDESYTPVKIDGKIWSACWRSILPGESGWWHAVMGARR